MMPIAANLTAPKGGAYRMSLPAWRIFGARSDDAENEENLSREELEGLFQDVLQPGQDGKKLSPDELSEKHRIARIRAALRG